MSLVSRAQAARAAVADLAANGPGFFKRRERAAHDAIRQFVDRARTVPDNMVLPDAERDELRRLIGGTVESIEGYLAGPGDHAATGSERNRELVKAVYALREAEERVSQSKRFPG